MPEPTKTKFGLDTLNFNTGTSPQGDLQDSTSSDQGNFLTDEQIRNFTIQTQREFQRDRKSTRLNSSHIPLSRMPSSA